jgi:hypothetical protein
VASILSLDVGEFCDTSKHKLREVSAAHQAG